MVDDVDLDAEITGLIRRYLTDLVGRPDQELSDDLDLVADLMLDSLDFVALIAELESHWDLRIRDADATLQHFGTIGAIRAYLHRALGDRAQQA